LSGIYDIAHGEGLAIVFPAWMKNAAETNPKMIVQMGERVFGIAPDSPNAPALAIAALEAFYKSIGLPVRLSEIGITDKDFDEMTKKALNGQESFGGYVKLDRDAVMNIFKLAL